MKNSTKSSISLLVYLISLVCVNSIGWCGTTFNPFTGKLDKCVTVVEEDGDPTMVTCADLEVSNGTLTADADGNYSLTTGGGAAGNSFETIDVPAGTDPVAESSTDTLIITETSPLVITGTAATDTIDITMTTSPASAATVVGTGRTLTVAGTANQITSSAGAQDLSADRTWTLSTPQDIATTSSPTFGNLALSGTGPDLTLNPTGGDAWHLGAESGAAGGVAFFSNTTDGKHIWRGTGAGNFQLPQIVSCLGAISTSADGTVVCQTDPSFTTVTATGSGLSTFTKGLTVNNGAGTATTDDFAVKDGSGSGGNALLVDVSAGTITSAVTTNIGWSVPTGTDTACNTTCVSACVFGWTLAAGLLQNIVACTDAAADQCLCAGSS